MRNKRTAPKLTRRCSLILLITLAFGASVLTVLTPTGIHVSQENSPLLQSVMPATTGTPWIQSGALSTSSLSTTTLLSDRQSLMGQAQPGSLRVSSPINHITSHLPEIVITPSSVADLHHDAAATNESTKMSEKSYAGAAATTRDREPKVAPSPAEVANVPRAPRENNKKKKQPALSVAPGFATRKPSNEKSEPNATATGGEVGLLRPASSSGAAQLRDDSLERLGSSKWWGSAQLAFPPTAESSAPSSSSLPSSSAASASSFSVTSSSSGRSKMVTISNHHQPKPKPARRRGGGAEKVALSSAGSKRRTYVVASYGGCGSKMLSGWLFTLSGAAAAAATHHPSTTSAASTPASVSSCVSHVYHVHDRSPPSALRSFEQPVKHRRAPPGGSKSKHSLVQQSEVMTAGSDFRAKSFAGEATFPTHTALVSARRIDDYRVVFIYKDPVEALVSRYDHTHCTHVQGDCGPNASAWPSLHDYAIAGQDRMKLRAHFDAFMAPSKERSYPVVGLNYHKLWVRVLKGALHFGQGCHKLNGCAACVCLFGGAWVLFFNSHSH